MLVGEPAALRRVATRIAEGDDPADVFEAVAVEVGQLLDADATRLLRYEHDRAASIVAGYGARDPGLDVGARATLDRSQAWGRVAATGQRCAPITSTRPPIRWRAGAGPGHPSRDPLPTWPRSRARAGAPASGYLAPPRRITRADVPNGDVFEAPGGYRANSSRIWGR